MVFRFEFGAKKLTGAAVGPSRLYVGTGHRRRRPCRQENRRGWLALALVAAAATAEARITRIVIDRSEPAFAGANFAPVGTYTRLIGHAFGEVDPALPQNAVIQDIGLAPRNARGMVEYTTDIDVVTPADPARGNGTLLFHVVNRGNKLELMTHNDGTRDVAKDLNALSNAGDGWLQRQGYTLIFFGWQADVLPGRRADDAHRSGRA